MKRNGGISISMIVIASIGVIVLSIVAALVIQTSGDIQQETGCEARSGTCTVADSCPDGQTDIGLDCPQEDAKCCRDITNS